MLQNQEVCSVSFAFSIYSALLACYLCPVLSDFVNCFRCKKDVIVYNYVYKNSLFQLLSLLLLEVVSVLFKTI